MSSGTKVALVALLVLMVVVIARLVKDEAEPDDLGGIPDGTAPRAGDGKQTTSGPDAQRAGLLAQSRPSQPSTKGKDSLRSTDPSQRATSPSPSSSPSSDRARSGADPARSTPPGSSSPSLSGSDERLEPPGSPNDPRLARSSPPSPAPIFGAPDGDAKEPPVSVAGAAGVAPASNAAASAPAGPAGASEKPVVRTHLRADGAAGSESGSSTRTDPSAAIPASGAGPRQEIHTGEAAQPGGGARNPLAQTPVTGRSPAESVKLKDYGASSSVPAGSGADFPVSYEIQPEDNLWNLARRFYGGRGHLYKHIESSNPGVKIQPGKTLIIPAPPPPAVSSRQNRTPGEPSDANPESTTPRTERYGNIPPRARETAPPPARSRTYKVQKGETLWDIAGRVYGDPTQYVRIKNANPQLTDADKVKAGTEILIP